MQGRRQKNIKPPSKSNRRYESLFDFRKMVYGLMKLCADDEVVLCLDREGLIQCINEGAARSWLNQDASRLINRCVWELLPPKVVERRKLIADKVFATGVPQRVAGEHRGRWLDSMVYPVHDQDGNIPLVLILSRDITEYKQKEKKLQESEAHFRKAIAEASVDAIYTVDQSGTIIFWNKAASKLFGYKENEVLGKSNSMLLPKRLREIDSKAKKQLLKTESYEFKNKLNESVALRKDGTEFPVEITISNWKLNDRLYFTAILRDITERKQYEEGLKEREARFRTIAESSQDAIITADSSGKILYWNKAAETIYGYAAEEIVGKSIELLRPEGKRLSDRKNTGIFLKTGQSRYIGKTVEGEACKKDGAVFLTETSTSCWEIGGQTIFCGIVRDITERKQHEREIEEREEQFRAITESSPDAILTIDSRGKILYGNKSVEKVYGYTAEELVGKSIAILEPEALRGASQKGRDIFVREGRSSYFGKTLEAIGVRKDGKQIPLEVSSSHWKMGGEAIFGGIIRDITKRKQMEEQLRRSHDALEDKVKQRTDELRVSNEKLQISEEHLKNFAGMLLSAREEERKNISTTMHDELGTLAIAVDSQISIAKEECNQNNKKATFEALTKAQAALRESVADLRRIAVDLRPPNLDIMGLNAALTELLDKTRQQATFKITFRNELGQKKIPEDRAIVIYRVIQEGLTNITKHAKAKTLRIRLYADTRDISLDITDDGIGCDLDKVLYGKGKPRIGIAGMRERVESLGGKIIITSVPKQGTQLKVTLPVK